MRINFSLKRVYYAGETIGQNIEIYLRECYSVTDVIECIKHEVLHAVLNQIGESNCKQDHRIFKLMDIDIF